MSKVLNRPVLVLNKAWQAVNVRPLKRVLNLVWSENARIVDPSDYSQYTWSDWAQLRPAEGEDEIRCVGFSLRIPEVITLVQYSRVPNRSVPFSRRNLFIRDEFQCQYCGQHLKSEDITVDHIIPRSRGGQSTWVNCVVACVQCNKFKADRLIKEVGMHLRKVPAEPQWRPDFHCKLRVPSWEKFVSELYWNVELEK